MLAKLKYVEGAIPGKPLKRQSSSEAEGKSNKQKYEEKLNLFLTISFLRKKIVKKKLDEFSREE